MVTWDLIITIYDRYSDFEVRNLFRNQGLKTTVGIAFPIEEYTFEQPVILRFESWADGKKVPHTYQNEEADCVSL